MKISILSFGIVKDIFGGKNVCIELPENATVNDLKNKLDAQFPPLSELASCLIAVNNEYAEDDWVLHTDDEVAIIPPVSGG